MLLQLDTACTTYPKKIRKTKWQWDRLPGGSRPTLRRQYTNQYWPFLLHASVCHPECTGVCVSKARHPVCYGLGVFWECSERSESDPQRKKICKNKQTEKKRKNIWANVGGLCSARKTRIKRNEWKSNLILRRQRFPDAFLMGPNTSLK